MANLLLLWAAFFQCQSTLSVEKLILIFNLNLVQPEPFPQAACPVVLLLVTWEKRQILTLLLPPFKCFEREMRLPWVSISPRPNNSSSLSLSSSDLFLQTLPQLCCPSLDMVQHFSLSCSEGPELDAGLTSAECKGMITAPGLLSFPLDSFPARFCPYLRFWERGHCGRVPQKWIWKFDWKKNYEQKKSMNKKKYKKGQWGNRANST